MSSYINPQHPETFSYQQDTLFKLDSDRHFYLYTLNANLLSIELGEAMEAQNKNMIAHIGIAAIAAEYELEHSEYEDIDPEDFEDEVIDTEALNELLAFREIWQIADTYLAWMGEPEFEEFYGRQSVAA